MSVYSIITERILEKLAAGVVPWSRPWAKIGMPVSVNSGKCYRGINAFLLACAGYSDSRWLTFHQAKERGWSVRKGEHGFPCIFWQRGWTRKAKDGSEDEKVDAMVLRYYTVFNLSQVDGKDIPPLDLPGRALSPLESAERVITGYSPGPALLFGQDRAAYCPSQDLVAMPNLAQFHAAEKYYAVFFHELAHSTGHATRLARKGIMDTASFGSADYSREELIAEMGAAFLCGHCGIDNTLDHSAAYLAGWMRQLRADERLIVIAAAQAQKAADLVLGVKFAD